ncbi:MAG: FMN-binding protein [Vallitaleaceae bacterium]|nr:FMN-binding protein [Vallitaleaceae bacterium]
MGKIGLVLLLLALLLVACTNKDALYVAGTYEGEAEGYQSILKVEVTVDENHILDIQVIAHEEAPIIAEAVLSKIPERVIKKNSTAVDTVSGATYTSNTLLKAIDQALSKATLQD